MHHEHPVRELDPFAHRGETHPPALQVLAGLAGVEPLTVVDHLDAQLTARRLHCDGHRDRTRVLDGVRQRLLDDAVSQGLEVMRDLDARMARELGLDLVVASEPVDRLAERRDQTPLLQERRAQPGHQSAEVVGLLRELGADLGEDAETLVALTGLQHQEHGLERQRRGRDALHRTVVQVPRDAVAFALDRRVGPAHEARPVLVAVLEELEQRPDRLVGDASGCHVADEQQPPRRVAGDLRGPRFEVHRVAFALERPLAGRGQRGEVLIGLDRRGERGPGLAFDERLGELDHVAEGAVRADDHVVGVELDDAVDRGLEDGAQALLGLAQGLVRALEPGERLVGPAESDLLLLERVVHGPLRVRSAHLVDEDPKRDRGGEHTDQQRALPGVDLLRALGDGDEAEGAARRRDRERREHGLAVPGGVLAPIGHLAGDEADEHGDEERAERDRQVDIGPPDLERPGEPQVREGDDAHAHRADRDEHPQVRDVRPRERQRAVGREPRGHDQRELGRRRESRRPRGGIGAKVQEQHRADRRAEQRHIRRDLATILPGDVLAELDRHGDQEQRSHRQEREVVQAETGGFGPGRLGDQERPAHDRDREDPEAERGRAPPGVLPPAPEQDHDRRQQTRADDDREPHAVEWIGRIARGRVRESNAAARDEEDEGREPWGPALCLRGHRRSDHDGAGGPAPPSPDRGHLADRP